MKAKYISLIKPNKKNAHSIGRTVLESIKITDDRSIIDTLLALSWVARALNETLKTERKDLGDNFENQIFMDDSCYLNNVWHENTEEPQEEKDLLLMYSLKDRKIFSIGLYDSSAQKVFVSEDRNSRWKKLSFFAKWAYIEDILPTKEN